MDRLTQWVTTGLVVVAALFTAATAVGMIRRHMLRRDRWPRDPRRDK